MRLPRDVSGESLAAGLESFGYRVTRQKGSHIRLTTFENGEHHVTIPNHDPLRLGTPSGILTPSEANSARVWLMLWIVSSAERVERKSCIAHSLAQQAYTSPPARITAHTSSTSSACLDGVIAPADRKMTAS